MPIEQLWEKINSIHTIYKLLSRRILYKPRWNKLQFLWILKITESKSD